MKFLLILLAVLSAGTLSAEELRFWMNAKINGQEVRLAMDTGANYPVLFRGTLERLKLGLTNPPSNVRLPPGLTNIQVTLPVDFSYATITGQIQFAAIDMPKYADTQLDGIFSWNYLRSNIWVFDPMKGLDLRNNIPAEALSWPKFNLPTHSDLLGFVATDDYLQPHTIYIDTGADFGLGLSPELWAKWRAAHPNQPSTISSYANISAKVFYTEEVWADSFSLGTLTWCQLPLHEIGLNEVPPSTMPNLAAIMGMAGLRRMDLVVDGIHGVLYARPRTDAALAYEHNLLGALFAPADDNSTPLLAHVGRNSPAYLAGIRDGDQLLKIDDLDVTEWQTQPGIMPLSRFWREKPPGTRYQLTLKRGDREFQAKVALERILAPTSQRSTPIISPADLRAKAENGDAESQYNMATYWLTDLFGKRDEAEAAKWYRRAAEQNFAEAQYQLGCAYSFGKGVTLNPEEAVKWFRKAAEQDHAEAQFNLGVCYAKGQGVAKDALDGVYWLRKAAEQNHAQAQLNLGVCFAMGEGTPKDMIEACKWMLLAARQGEANAKTGVNQMLEQLSKEDFARAQNMANAFKPRPSKLAIKK